MSSVPPVWPRPRPDIIPTRAPAAATSGARTSVTLSPTPPVECLSTTGARSDRSHVSPESRIAWVNAAVSAVESPRITAAIRNAEAWYSGTSPETTPETR